MKKQLSIKKISELTGKSLPTVYRWINGTCQVSAFDAHRLEEITGVKAAAWMLPDKYKNPYYRSKGMK
jgi:predicted DNA-binding transcriptional regulator AlpA